MAMVKVMSGLTAAAGTQALLTMVSLTYSLGGGQDYVSSKIFGRSSDNKDKVKRDQKNQLLHAKESFDARHYDFVTEMVTNMYAGSGAKHDHVILDHSTTFEDPAAICKGKPEFQEAFRALTHLQPQSLNPPTCVHVQPHGDSILLTYALNQRYLGRLELRSLLMVQVQLQRRHDVPESDFLVLRMEEHWNGIPPLSSYLFWAVRRVNGIVSHQLTSRLLS
jgi:hypothetical protein